MSGAPGMPYTWTPEYGARLGVLRRDDPYGPVRWFDIDLCYVFHTLNAHEEADGSRLVLHEDRRPSLGDGVDVSAGTTSSSSTPTTSPVRPSPPFTCPAGSPPVSTATGSPTPEPYARRPFPPPGNEGGVRMASAVLAGLTSAGPSSGDGRRPRGTVRDTRTPAEAHGGDGSSGVSVWPSTSRSCAREVMPSLGKSR
jgi:hypothetical protein